MARRPAEVLVYYPDQAEARRYASLVRAPRGRVRLHVAGTPEEAAAIAGDIDVLFAWRFPADLLAKAGRLTWIQSMGAGAEWALGPGLPDRVVVTRAPGIFGPWMAEYVLGWCAWVTLRMAEYREAQRRREWIDHVLPRRLAGTTMLIIGLGDIGRTIARAARAIGIRVLGASRSGRPVPGVERVWRASALRTPLARADWVVLVVPLTPRTRGLIGAAELAVMRPAAWLVNVGRGAVVDEAALVEALEARRIGGAVLDVFPVEPLPRDHPLWGLDNAVVTPHISGPNVPEELTAIFHDNLARWLAGRRLRHVIDRRRGY
jgi:phosphoglycerate dehydrogenase-like enzyme